MNELLSPDALPVIDELPGDLRLIAEVIGVPMTIRLAERFGGAPLYIYKIDSFIRKHRNKAIRDEFDRRTAQGESATQVVNDIARRPGMPCVRQMWDIINAPDDRQMSLWG
jgi:hypothetical protein